MEEKSRSPYTHAALVADALSLGPHWIYNQSKIARLYPDGVTDFTDPESQYHPNRKAGQFTHYGDQTAWLGDLLASGEGYDLDRWRRLWTSRMKDYDGFLDGASKDTLATDSLSPSSSNDLAGASRIAPLLDLGLSLDETITAARSQTSLTHGDPGVIDAAEFFVRSVFAIRDGLSISEAFDRAAAEGSYEELDPAAMLNQARQADPDDVMAEAGRLGLTCHNPEAFPLTLYLALLPGSNFRDTISLNGLAGGDTSARAMLLALLFAARDGAPDIDLPPADGPSAMTPGSHRIEIPGPMVFSPAFSNGLKPKFGATRYLPTVSPAARISSPKNASPWSWRSAASPPSGSIFPGSANRGDRSRKPPSSPTWKISSPRPTGCGSTIPPPPFSWGIP